MKNKFRILKLDQYSWTVEKYDAGGEIIDRGRYKGQAKKPRWVTIGYYPTLEYAAKSLLDEVIGDNWTGNSIAETIIKATKEVKSYVKDCLDKMEDETLADILQKRGYTVISSKKGRKKREKTI